jgi:hypothetical protein
MFEKTRLASPFSTYFSVLVYAGNISRLLYITSIVFQLATSCPSTSSCGTGTPGWLPGGHPKPEDGMVRRKVCFHYDGNCCYKALYIDVINCPGMYVYGLVNTVFDFAARYCFEDDKKSKSPLLC